MGNRKTMTVKERQFCRAYAEKPDAVRAARVAGYSEQYAIKRAYEILDRPHVIDEVKRLCERINERVEKSATDVVNEFSKIAFTDRVDFLKEDPNYPGEFIYKAPDELTPDQRAIVEKVTYNNHEITIIEDGKVEKVWIKQYAYVLSDKSKALEQMGRHFGLFDDKLRLTSGNRNPFINVSPKQVEALRASWVKTMNDPKLFEGEAVVLEDG